MTIAIEITDTETLDTTCHLCGFQIDPLDIEDTRRGPQHADRQCPTGAAPKPKRATRTRKTPERKLAEGAGLVKNLRDAGLTLNPASRSTGSHSNCEHPATKSARAACRKRNAG